MKITKVLLHSKKFVGNVYSASRKYKENNTTHIKHHGIRTLGSKYRGINTHCQTLTHQYVWWQRTVN